jgi:hypothetical protein
MFSVVFALRLACLSTKVLQQKKLSTVLCSASGPQRAFGAGRAARLFHLFRFRAVLKAGAF